ncbi:NCS1 family nucleobase:cation symporter-1 [Uruburuella testudinis]|uniref:NCS1 family nucleobase:cation symporter-1 n=1 Tax=Uruburuella testudinis TaxID=1282863 RepID=A0ABY4DUQ3_9NEIS|nr:NCS1 family nucleobase:cation symporter-1 [Uruburuella testudinis]UOO82183.1 NCS1 family nucleobase:cation symporter-1 [Uruburuella testudinis]
MEKTFDSVIDGAMAPSAGQTDSVSEEYSHKLYNNDLAPLSGARQNWSWYNIFAFWMSDVHSVGGYVFAGSLFALGLHSWQVLISLIVGIVIVQFLCNLVAKPSQQAGVPYPVACRMAFGVFGANVPAVIRGLIAVAWYGIQTFLASKSLDILILWAFPAAQGLAETSLLGLSLLGWLSFGIMWVLQAAVFWHGMDTIKKFIDWAGPAVYVVMLLLAIWIVQRAGLSNISLNLGEVKYFGSDAILPMLTAIALVVSYFSGPMLNFGDFSRYGKSFKAVKKGNFWGLPINFTLFALVTVIITSGTIPVFGEMLTDPIDTVARIDNVGVMLLGAFTFVTATIGINIVANFVSPAFDFANVAPQHISFRIGGFIAAIGSVFIMPWNLFNSPETIHYTLDMLSAFIGPLFGILLADFYIVRQQKIDVDALYSTRPDGAYWYRGGWNIKALLALIPPVAVGVSITLAGIKPLADFNWFIGCALGFILYLLLMKRSDNTI